MTDDMSYWMETGDEYFRAEDFDRALYNYDGALSVDPNHTDALLRKGMVLVAKYDDFLTDHFKSNFPKKYEEAKQKYIEALELFDTVLEKKNGQKDAWIYNGIASLRLGDTQKADSCFKTVERIYRWSFRTES